MLIWSKREGAVAVWGQGGAVLLRERAKRASTGTAARPHVSLAHRWSSSLLSSLRIAATKGGSAAQLLIASSPISE